MTGSFHMDPEGAERMATLMKAIAHPVRLRVMSLLREGEVNVSQMIARLGISQAALSNQLAILRMNGLVDVRREGGFAWYRLNLPRLGEVLNCLECCREGTGEEPPAKEVR